MADRNGNQNLLAYMQCPECGWFQSFIIWVSDSDKTRPRVIRDDRTIPDRRACSFNTYSRAFCGASCGWGGIVADLKEAYDRHHYPESECTFERSN